MSCNSCGTSENGLPKGCNNNGACGSGGCNTKLTVFDWLANMEFPGMGKPFDIVEVRFKNSRKEFYKLEPDMEFFKGDLVAVEASPGHDIGVVSLTGDLVKLQMKKKNVRADSPEVKKVYRKAKQMDIDKWQSARELEEKTMYKARTIAVQLKLQMKISDVEYQGDKTKAIFYYTAEDRVDFRELIKVLADEFKVRIEMKQIGARQEAGRLGGIGSCGRELCCSTWLTDFRSVSTSAARYQQLSLNPLKLAGQCGKLKCCLNYELDSYMDAIKDFPESGIKLFTKSGAAFHQKTDIFKRTMWYSYESDPGTFIPLSIDTVKEIIEQNKNKVYPPDFTIAKPVEAKKTSEMYYENVVGQDSLTRFDQDKNKRKKKKKNNNRNKPTGEVLASTNAINSTESNENKSQINPPNPSQTPQNNNQANQATTQAKQNTRPQNKPNQPNRNNNNRNKPNRNPNNKPQNNTPNANNAPPKDS
jgi:cell fate regulator YaaT (PSP1 superfamily)